MKMRNVVAAIYCRLWTADFWRSVTPESCGTMTFSFSMFFIFLSCTLGAAIWGVKSTVVGLSFPWQQVHENYCQKCCQNRRSWEDQRSGLNKLGQTGIIFIPNLSAKSRVSQLPPALLKPQKLFRSSKSRAHCVSYL